MKRIFSALLVFSMILSSSACIRTERVKAIEGSEDVPPYRSLGSLEVKQKAPYVTPGGILFTGVEILTLSFAKTPSRGDHYKRTLRAELAEIASKHYGADKVIHVEYWPDPDSNSFPDGYVYGRGEMIKYERFPKEEEVEVTVIEGDASSVPEPQAETPEMAEKDQKIKREIEPPGFSEDESMMDPNAAPATMPSGS